jgi:hypothetical protein
LDLLYLEFGVVSSDVQTEGDERMKSLGRAMAAGLMLQVGLAATTVYQLNFSGTITSGQAQGFNPAISGNSLTTFADLTGMHVTGSLTFDLGLAPVPTVSVDSSGFVTTAIQTTTLPVYVSESLTIDGFTVPAGFFPMPIVFNQPPVPTIPGATLSVLNSQQALHNTVRDNVSAESILGGLNFQTSWNGERLNGGTVTNYDVLITGVPAFTSIPAAGSFPDNWGPTPVGGNGVFGFSTLSSDAATQTNFGITQWYFVNGNFNMETASGVFVAPEPGTLAVGALSTLMMGWGRRRYPHEQASRSRMSIVRCLPCSVWDRARI